MKIAWITTYQLEDIIVSKLFLLCKLRYYLFLVVTLPEKHQ